MLLDTPEAVGGWVTLDEVVLVELEVGGVEAGRGGVAVEINVYVVWKAVT